MSRNRSTVPGPGGLLPEREWADWLATALREAWQAEALRRQASGPWVVPVRWALSGVGGQGLTVPDDPRPGWVSAYEPAVAGAAGDGTVEELATLLGQPPAGRLVVVGEPGAGTSTMLVRLVLEAVLDDACRRGVLDQVGAVYRVCRRRPPHRHPG